jgi:DNA-binding CsgD family transcriptional regulator
VDMVITQREFWELSQRYRLSPRQCDIVEAILSGALHIEDLSRTRGINPRTLASQLYRINKKMHSGSLIEILYRFGCDAKAIRP